MRGWKVYCLIASKRESIVQRNDEQRSLCATAVAKMKSVFLYGLFQEIRGIEIKH